MIFLYCLIIIKKQKKMKKFFTSDDNCNGSSYLCPRNHKSKTTTAKMAKVDGAGMAFFRNY
jgi:hypothetical protein